MAPFLSRYLSGDDKPVDPLQSTMDAINRLQQSPQAERVLSVVDQKAKALDARKKLSKLYSSLTSARGEGWKSLSIEEKLAKVKSGNLAVLDDDEGRAYAFDWDDSFDESWNEFKRPATESELSEQKELLEREMSRRGISEFRERERWNPETKEYEKIPSDVILEDVKSYKPSAHAFQSIGRTFMPKEPIDPKRKMFWEMANWHERGHQERDLSKEGNLSLKGRFWSERPEEQQAIRDALSVLQENYAQANVPYNPIDAYRWVSGGSKAEAMENPSKAPFVNRLEYLPTGPEYKPFTLQTDWRNVDEPIATTHTDPREYIDTLKQVDDRLWRSGAHLAQDVPNLDPSITHKLRTHWDLAEEGIEDARLTAELEEMVTDMVKANE